MNDNEKKVLQSIIDEASPEPWDANVYHEWDNTRITAACGRGPMIELSEGNIIKQALADGRFISVARSLVPLLIQQNDELEALFQQTHGVHSSWVALAETNKQKVAKLEEKLSISENLLNDAKEQNKFLQQKCDALSQQIIDLMNQNNSSIENLNFEVEQLRKLVKFQLDVVITKLTNERNELFLKLEKLLNDIS